MKRKYSSIFVAYFLVHHLFVYGQTDTTSGNYKRYTDKHNRFSFLMPIEWNILVDKDGELPDMAFSIKKDTTKDYQTEIFIINYYEYKGVNAICDSAFMCNRGFSVFYRLDDPDFMKIGKSIKGDRYFASYASKIVVVDDEFWNKEADSVDTRVPSNTDTLFYMHGKTWKGYRHSNQCIAVQSYDHFRGAINGFHGDYCQTFYLYDGKHPIIEMVTNGNQLEEKVIKKLIDSFKFY